MSLSVFTVGQKRRRRPALKRLGAASDQSGSAAVEFAIVAPIFLVMMFSMFEVGWFYFANSVVDAAVADAGRLVKTGQLQTFSNDPEEQFDLLYETVCDIVQTFGACATRLTVEAKTYSSFAALAADTDPTTCADAPPDDIAAIEFSPGADLQIVRLRICYIYTTVNPIVGIGSTKTIRLGESGTNQRRLISTMIFRNEPYSRNSST
jgi:hypothetical protein